MASFLIRFLVIATALWASTPAGVCCSIPAKSAEDSLQAPRHCPHCQAEASTSGAQAAESINCNCTPKVPVTVSSKSNSTLDEVSGLVLFLSSFDAMPELAQVAPQAKASLNFSPPPQKLQPILCVWRF